MKSNTKLVVFIKNCYEKISKKFVVFKVYFTSSIFFLFFGILAGNLFGSLLNIFSESFIWHGSITILILMIVELINYLLYHNKNRALFLLFIFQNVPSIKPIYDLIRNTKLRNDVEKYSKLTLQVQKTNTKKIFFGNLKKKFLYNKFTKKIFIKNINLLKMGILFGFFIDAFKVGS